MRNAGIISSLADVLYSVIAEAGEHGIPSGHLYAMLLGKMSLDTYTAIIDLLVATSKITNSGHLLKVKNPT